ncbi:hypothetical protein KSX_87100 [Ktedonospora formicarum]|uniref:Uncharacterized protein n=1 Tax=Ktedonospora formicarum TaxID=2778364 RepID=A0A8J3MVP5_9CHLR|nr:hypothetical protein KSX_87100 [Ktedonospora formicarum]
MLGGGSLAGESVAQRREHLAWQGEETVLPVREQVKTWWPGTEEGERERISLARWCYRLELARSE